MALKFKNISFLILVFLLFFTFSITGSNTYIFNTFLSLKNIFFLGLLLSFFILRGTKLTQNQVVIILPIFILYSLGFIYLIGYRGFHLEMLKDFFYFSFIPILLISIFLLGNKFKGVFFNSVYKLSKILLYLLFSVTVLELITGLHLPSHKITSENIPTAFFTNPNDLAVVAVGIYMLLIFLGKKQISKKQNIILSIVTGFIIFITLSRMVFIVFCISLIVNFLSVKIVKRFFGLTIVLTVLLFIISNIEVPINSNSVIDRSIIRIQTISDLKAQKNNGESSISVRYDIYSIPFRHPKEFILGKGFNSDHKIIQKYKTLNHSIINSHSFFIQLIFYFGWLGLVLLLAFFGIVLTYSTANKYPFLFIMTISQMLIINIPSSIMRMPVIWIPFFILISYHTTQKQNEKEYLPHNNSTP